MLKFLFCLFIFFPAYTFAQNVLQGKLFIKGTPDLIPNVSVINKTHGGSGISDLGGNFRVAAEPGDTVLFTSAGYQPDTVYVETNDLRMQHDVDLTPLVTVLQSVEVDAMSKFIADSLQRRKDYAELFNKKHPVKLWNEKRDMDDPGLNFSPIGYNSATEKQKRRFKKRLREEDESEYIDVRFPRSRVAQLTGLKGDSLQLFMQRFTPGYAWCRNAGNQDVLLWINDKLVLFRQVGVATVPGQK